MAIRHRVFELPSTVWHKNNTPSLAAMKISRTTVLLLSTAVVTMTSIGISSFSLFLRPMEADFGWSRAMVTLPYMLSLIHI